MTNLIKGIVFLPIESKRQLKYEIIKSNNITERGKLGTQDFDGYIITIGYCDYKSQEAITQSKHIPPIPFPFALQFSHTRSYRAHRLLCTPGTDTIQTADIPSYKV